MATTWRLVTVHGTRHPTHPKGILIDPETFSADDISKFAQYKPETRSARRARLLVLTLADTGLRLSEALNLRWKDVDLDNCLVSVLRKGRKERDVFEPE